MQSGYVCIMKKTIVGILLFAMVMTSASPVLGYTTVIARLGATPLFATTSSVVGLQTQMSREQDRVARASVMLGLSPSEYREVRQAIARGEVRALILPRHLDAMAFYRNGNVHVAADVIIPAQTKGWEVDVNEPGQTIRVLIPMICGNMSVLRVFHPMVARAKTPRHAVESSVEHAAYPRGPAPIHVAPSQAAVAEASPAPAVSGTPAPITSIPAPGPSHHVRWPWMLPILAVLLFHGSSSSSPNPPVTGGGGGCPR